MGGVSRDVRTAWTRSDSGSAVTVVAESERGVPVPGGGGPGKGRWGNRACGGHLGRVTGSTGLASGLTSALT